ncbi:MAG: NAD(P)-binding domain-containing protein [Myxococcales bacterium]|nr:NAD(P)-binding domain-containing protein [Myxococcales bacterium]
MRVAVIGSGVVGETLANGFLKHGHSVMRASRSPEKLSNWRGPEGSEFSVGDFAEASAWGEVVVLAVKGTAAVEAVTMCGAENLAGKPVIDATNPIANLAPVNGVLQFFTGPNESLMEMLQKAAPDAHFVKAFSCVGNAFMVDPDFGGEKPTMFICGNQAGAKAAVSELLVDFGWDVEDMGSVESARAIEPLCMLWCIPGIRGGKWSHAFRLLHA